MNVKGIITAVLPETSGVSKSGKNWRKKEAVVQYESGQYPKSIVFQMMGDAIDKLNIQQGQEYDLSIDFEAREWNGRYFLQASCWKAAPTQQPQQAPTQQGWEQMYQQPQAQQTQSAHTQDDRLPF